MIRMEWVHLIAFSSAFGIATANTHHRALRGDSYRYQSMMTTAAADDRYLGNHARGVVVEPEESIDTATLLSMPISFQVCVSVFLGVVIILQLYLTISLIRKRNKRVLEFAQPQALCIFLVSAVVATSGCFLFIYISDIGCAMRDPVIFTAISTMGATCASRTWRISSLMNNPLLSIGDNMYEEGEGIFVPRVEAARQKLLRTLTFLSGFECNGCTLKNTQINNQRNFRLKVSSGKMMLVTAILVAPQLVWQVLTISILNMRSKGHFTNVSNIYGVETGAERYECVSPTRGSWPFWIALFFAFIPFGGAYLLNIQPQRELNKLPYKINERSELLSSFITFIQILAVAGPTFGMAVAPHVKAYTGIVIVLGLTLPLCYHIGHAKLIDLERSDISNASPAIERTDSSFVSTRLVVMYERIGLDEKCVEAIDEKLSTFMKGKRGNLGIGASRQKEEIGAGFTADDLKDISADDLKLIINLLLSKGKALIRLHGNMAGQKLCAKVNVDSIAIFENCPSSRELDASIMFPVYSICSAHLKGGMIQQDDVLSLERDIADRFCKEAQTQSFHLARALAQQAEILGRIGLYDDAFAAFEKMRMIYLPDIHRKLLTKTYAQDRCAQCFSYSAGWFMQQGKMEEAIDRCNLVIEEFLPKYDEADLIGIYHLFFPILRVLKWYGHVRRAKEVFEKLMPDNRTHPIMGPLRKPILLLLNLWNDAEGDTKYDEENLVDDVTMVLEFDVTDFTDNVFTAIGFSLKSFIAELCLLLAQRLDSNSCSRVSLIQKGIRFSLVADDRLKGSNKKVKHLLAFGAHRAVFSELLKLVQDDNDQPLGSVYDQEIATFNGSFSRDETSKSLANRLVLRKSVSALSDSPNTKKGKLTISSHDASSTKHSSSSH